MIEYVRKRQINTRTVALYDDGTFKLVERTSRSTSNIHAWRLIEDGKYTSQSIDFNSFLVRPNVQPLFSISYDIVRNFDININEEFTIYVYVNIDCKAHGASITSYREPKLLDQAFSKIGRKQIDLAPETKRVIFNDLKSKPVQNGIKNFVKKYLLK